MFDLCILFLVWKLERLDGEEELNSIFGMDWSWYVDLEHQIAAVYLNEGKLSLEYKQNQ